jgi:hypothetical protein
MSWAAGSIFQGHALDATGVRALIRMSVCQERTEHTNNHAVNPQPGSPGASRSRVAYKVSSFAGRQLSVIG